ncbi:TonB-dependent receptor [Cellvibrio sp. pealriver]|uniref:TonB-dependent receptor n=1 Tax=Cellvibrio sp. pealriver TaxID=1622269 RepID=UPI00066FBA83|nr:TonB-dependent receptor [Cellvibrio sp. pealriver]
MFHQSINPLHSFTRALLPLMLAGYVSNACADTGKIRLTVIDATTQRPIPNATVTIVSRAGATTETRANAQGLLQVDALDAGLYTLLINHPNYQPVRLPRVRVLDSKTTPIETKLAGVSTGVEELLVVGKTMAGNPLNAAGTSFIDQEALNSAAGSGSDVLRSLDGLPGLFGDGEFSSFTVRGNGPRDNLILVDGIPFDKVVHFSDSFGEQEEIEGGGRYSVFAPNTIATAEFQPGGWNPAYGGRAGSLLKLNVAEGNPDTPSYRARLDIAGIEIGYDGPSGFHDQTSILFSARNYDFGRLFETIGLDDIGTPKLTDVIFKSTSELGDKDQLSFLVIYAPEEYQRTLDNVLASDEDEPGNYEDVELVDSEADNSLIALTWTRLIGSDGELTNQIYMRNYDERSTTGEAYPDLVEADLEGMDPPLDTTPVRNNILRSEAEEKELGLQTDIETNNRFGRLSSGLRITQVDLAFSLNLADDWIRYTYDQNDYRENPEQKYVVLTPEAINNRYTQTETNYALYANQEFTLGDWSFRAGARYDRDNFSDENLVSPRAGATWLVNNNLRITTTAGRYFQSPRFNDRASDANNSQLENEIIDQVSVGFLYRWENNIELLIEPYYQDLHNLVVKEDSVNQTLDNTGEGKSYGVDTGITRLFDNGWSASINYSYNDARVRDYPSATEYDADFNRPHIVSIGGVWEINQRWKLSSRWKWASGKPNDAYIIHSNVLGDGQPLRYSRETIAINTDRYGSYSSLNFRADYLRTFGQTNVIAFVDVINVLGSENPGNSDFNERSGIEEVEEGEALPIIGLMFEW